MPPEDCVRIIKDARADVRFASVPPVVGRPHIRFYAGAPLVSRDGYKLGALCILDTAGRAMLECLAALSKPCVVR